MGKSTSQHRTSTVNYILFYKCFEWRQIYSDIDVIHKIPTNSATAENVNKNYTRSQISYIPFETVVCLSIQQAF